MMSISTRITGDVAAGSFYVFGAAYAVSTAFGWQCDSAMLIDYYSSLHPFTKISAKAVLAFPVVYHCLNGTRYLFWDSLPKRFVNNVSVIRR